MAPDGQVWAAAQRLAGEVAGAAPAALLATRRLVDAAPGHSFDEHLDAEEHTIKSLWNGADVVEGVTAFVERRRPNFSGARSRVRRATRPAHNGRKRRISAPPTAGWPRPARRRT